MTTTPALNDDLVRELREEAMRLSGRSIDRGCIDSGIAANLAEKAASALEAQSKEIEALRAALEPFARHIDEMKFDLDNKGDPLPDDQAVGWVYVTNGDFRRARTALKGA